MKLNIYDTKQEVAEQFSGYLAKMISNGDEVHIALSGGSTPKIVFDHLAKEYCYKIDWSKVHLYWGDERCVPPDDEDSNYGMTKEHLLSHIDIPEENIHRILGEENPAEEAERYGELLDEKLPQENEIPRFDLVILGMGDDGHTASIFPHELYLWGSDHNCEVAIHPESGQKRITITGKVINNAREVAFLVTGAGKMERVREILHEEGPYETYPATLVDPKHGRLQWFLDTDAAKGLN